MTDNEQMKRNPAMVEKYKKMAGKFGAGASGDLIKAIWGGYSDSTSCWIKYEYTLAFKNAYRALCGFPGSECATVDDFFCQKLVDALQSFLGKEDAAHIIEVCRMEMEFPYSHTVYRPSYRSSRAGDYADAFFIAIVNALRFRCSSVALEKALTEKSELIHYQSGLDNRIAQELRKGNETFFALIEEAILGDNSEAQMNRVVISAIVKSGNERALELLGKLLLAAKGQEGLRQSILETCDCGTLESHIYFIRLILDNDLCRFSATIRAFATWSGMVLGNEKQKVVEKCVSLALKYLSDESSIPQGLGSNDTTEIYFALWAICCRDINKASESACALLDSAEKYKRLVGWYFITNTNSAPFRHNVAIKYLDVRDPEELAWICANLHINSGIRSNLYGGDEKDREKKVQTMASPDEYYPEDQAGRIALFEKMAEIATFIGKKSTKFTGSVFPWVEQALGAIAPCGVMLGLAAYDRSADLTRRVADFLPLMDVDQRHIFYCFLLNPEVPEQRALLLEGLSDKGQYVRKRVIGRLDYYQLDKADTDRLIKTLTTQSAELRKGIITLFNKQEESLIRPVIDALLGSQSKNQLIAGVELLEVFSKNNPSLQDEYKDRISELAADEKLSQDVSILLSKITQGKEKDEFGEDNGFGLFDPAAPDFDKGICAANRPKATIYSKKELEKLLAVSEKELCNALHPIRDVLLKNKDMECETERYDGGREKVLIGDCNYWLPMLPGFTHKRGRESNRISEFYLADEILAALDKAGVTPVSIAKILCYGVSGLDYKREFTPVAQKIFKGLPINQRLVFNKYVPSCSNLATNALNSVLEERREGVYDFAMSVWMSLVELIPEHEIMTDFQTKSPYGGYSRKQVECMYRIGVISAWFGMTNRFADTDEQFAALWNERWYEYIAAERKYLPEGDVLNLPRAYKQGLLSDDALFHELLRGANADGYMKTLTGNTNWYKATQKQVEDNYPQFSARLETAVDRVVTVEEKRGELPTPLSTVAAQIGYFKGGAGHFAALLTALGKDNFHRGYVWSGTDRTKKTTLSVLMKNCYPQPSDTAESFGAAVKAAGISEKRLLQAVMYAPQWADFAEKSTGIAGLSSAVWLFHAHINEKFSAEKETRVALYSPVTQQQFADGTFDRDWFLEAYHAVGETVFAELYKNAKYITDSSSAHRRSQLYTDAVLGRLDKAGTEAEIADKRNQEKLRAYALIPLDEKKPGDALSRYEFIQKFAKESKQFGAQRKASEGKAVLIALQNLALITGFGDSDRMSWYYESEKMDGLRYLMSPQDVGGAEVWLQFDEDGAPSLGVSKEGKTLKSLPKALAKNEAVLEVKAAVSDLRDQKRRARMGFEMAMVSRTAFRAAEILRLLGHPALGGMVSSLAFASEGSIGFPVANGDKLCLVTPDGTEIIIPEGAEALIAHPYDLIQSKCWSAYQQYLYKEQIVQPFKQVFREYYPVTEDELAEVNTSRRYAGHQVQPQKTVALLKTRGWTVDYYEGLQRVYHKENLIARMYAMADWFSPADIEAPTLEEVRFFSRDKDEPVAFADVPPVVFSEVMRDIDLVVSVAHVGGVDPEASHSTVEMRIAIARELLSMLSVKNVSFQTAHAQIKGTLGDYSVHMGSGVMHKSGTGMIAVLPVHSQARGRIFLPFADDDPKTAEILSKILLFADDAKIKDPGILDQLG